MVDTFSGINGKLIVLINLRNTAVIETYPVIWESQLLNPVCHFVASPKYTGWHSPILQVFFYTFRHGARLCVDTKSICWLNTATTNEMVLKVCFH